VKSQVTGRPVDVLLVDDSPGDMRLIVEALKDGGTQNRLHVAKDGMDAVAFLRRRGKHVDAPRPHLVLLDLNMPRMSGLQVLAEIKGDSELKHIPVVILSGSEDAENIVKTYNLHANCYVTKPVDLEQFTTVVKFIGDFWLTAATLPTEAG